MTTISKSDSVALSTITTAFISGGTPSTKESAFWGGKFPWTTSAPISKDAVLLKGPERFITKAGLEQSATNLVPLGSLLVATRLGVGKAVVNELPIAISQDLTGLVLDNDRAHALFVAYQFKTQRIQRYLESCSRGTTIQGISRFDVERIEIWLPPLAEQRAIADALRAVERSRETRERELRLEVERKAALVQSLFLRGTRAEARKQTDVGLVPVSWEVVELGTLITIGPQNGIYKPLSLYGDGTPIIRIDDFDNDGRLVTPRFQKVRLSPQEVALYQLEKGDILVNRVNSLSHLGKTILVGQLFPDVTVFESNMMRFKVDISRILPEYLVGYFLTAQCRAYVRGRAKRAVAQSSINQGDVRSTLIPLPSLGEQKEIISLLASCSKKVEKLGQEITLLDELKQASLEQFMSGRLAAAPSLGEEEES